MDGWMDKMNGIERMEEDGTVQQIWSAPANRRNFVLRSIPADILKNILDQHGKSESEEDIERMEEQRALSAPPVSTYYPVLSDEMGKGFQHQNWVKGVRKWYSVFILLRRDMTEVASKACSVMQCRYRCTVHWRILPIIFIEFNRIEQGLSDFGCSRSCARICSPQYSTV